MGATVGMDQPEVAAIYAALAVLIAGACGGFGSIYLRKRWSLPGRLRRPWLISALVILTSLLSLYLPLGWGWRLLINSSLFLFGSWVGGLIDRQDWQLLRRAFRSEEAKSTG
jgi:hypothetical protein